MLHVVSKSGYPSWSARRSTIALVLRLVARSWAAMASSSGGPLVAQGPCDAASSGSSSDEVMLSATPSAPARRRAKRCYAELLDQYGPLTLALLVGQPRGRWCPELDGSAKACKVARAVVSKAVGDGDDVGALRPNADVLVGIAVLRSWHCIRGAASHNDVYALVQASEAFHRKRTGQRFLEHEVVASAIFRSSDGTFDVFPDWAARPAGVTGRKLLQRITESSAWAEVTKGHLAGGYVEVSQGLATWKSE